MVFIVMKLVVAVFEGNVLEDQQAARHADCQSDYVDERETFLVIKITIGDLEVILEHADKFRQETFCNKLAITKSFILNQ